NTAPFREASENLTTSSQMPTGGMQADENTKISWWHNNCVGSLCNPGDWISHMTLRDNRIGALTKLALVAICAGSLLGGAARAVPTEVFNLDAGLVSGTV